MEALQDAKDGIVVAIIGLLYLHEGDLDIEHPVAVTIRFSGGHYVTFTCAPDGETLLATREHVEPVNMEDWGECIIADISMHAPWLGVVGRRMTAVHRCVDLDGITIGFEFEFDRSTVASILNLGDDIFQFDEIPVRLVSLEKLRKIEM